MKTVPNIVPNVYNCLQAHFCHLLGLGQVGHSPRGTIGVLGPWNEAQCGWAPSPLANPNTPPIPLMAQHPYPLGAPMPPYATDIPSSP